MGPIEIIPVNGGTGIPCPNNCVTILAPGQQIEPLPPLPQPPEGMEWLYDENGDYMYDGDGEKIYIPIIG